MKKLKETNKVRSKDMGNDASVLSIDKKVK